MFDLSLGLDFKLILSLMKSKVLWKTDEFCTTSSDATKCSPYIIATSNKNWLVSLRAAVDLDFQSPTKYRSTSGLNRESNWSFDHFDARLKTLELRKRLNMSSARLDGVLEVLCDASFSYSLQLTVHYLLLSQKSQDKTLGSVEYGL